MQSLNWCLPSTSSYIGKWWLLFSLLCVLETLQVSVTSLLPLCVCAHAHTHVHVHTCTYTHMHIHTHTHMHTHFGCWKGHFLLQQCSFSRLSVLVPLGRQLPAPHSLQVPTLPSLCFHAHKCTRNPSSQKNDFPKLSYHELCEPQALRAKARLAGCLVPFASCLKNQVPINFLLVLHLLILSHFASLSIGSRELS